MATKPNVYKVYSNLSNAKRAVKSAKLVEGEYALVKSTVTKGGVEIQDLRSATAAVMQPTPAVPAATQEVVKAVRAKRTSDAKAAKATPKPAPAVDPLVGGKPATVNPSIHGHNVHGFEKCPHCGIGLDNGVGDHMQEVGSGKLGVTKHVKHDKYAYACLGCGGEFGPTIRKRKAPATKVEQGRNQGGYTIQKQRVSKNGVKEYSPGTVGAKLWELCDTLAKKLGGVDKVLPQQLKDAATKAELNITSAGIAFYQWRRFNGVFGRINLKKAQAK